MVLDEIDHELLLLAKAADEALQDEYKKIEAQSLKASNKVLSAFIANSVSYSDFADVNGYGDFDPGRDKIENIFVGAKTGNLIIQTTNRANVGKQFSIDAIRNSFSSNGTRKEHWELDTIELTEKLLALLNEYNAQYDLAAKDANYVSRSENIASENVDKKATVGKELAADKKSALED